MKREIIAAVLLCTIIVCSIVNLNVFTSLANTLTENLDSCAEALSRGDISAAAESFSYAESRWDEAGTYVCIVLDGAVTERIDDGFFELSHALSVGSTEYAQELCRQLTDMIESAVRDQSPHPESIL